MSMQPRPPRRRPGPALNWLAAAAWCLLAGGGGVAVGAEGAPFTVTDDHGNSLLPARAFAIIDLLRFEALRAPTEAQLHSTVNVPATAAPGTAFAARLAWQPKELVVGIDGSPQENWKVAALALYLIRHGDGGMWQLQLWATGADGRICHCEKYDPSWSILVGDLIAAYYLKLLPAP